jgi:hypothetical protein
MAVSDYIKPGAMVLGVAAAAALGFAAGYAFARDPQLLRRTLRAASGGVERLMGAWAETREEIGDLWAEAREDARRAVEDDAFEQAGAAAAAATAAAARSAAATPAPESPAAESGKQRTPRRQSAKRTGTRAASIKPARTTARPAA